MDRIGSNDRMFAGIALDNLSREAEELLTLWENADANNIPLWAANMRDKVEHIRTTLNAVETVVASDLYYNVGISGDQCGAVTYSASAPVKDEG